MEFSRVCLLLGTILLVVGIVLKGFEPFAWFGRLPGDISYKSGSVTVWVPITSMLVVSVLATIVMKLANRIFP